MASDPTGTAIDDWRCLPIERPDHDVPFLTRRPLHDFDGRHREGPHVGRSQRDFEQTAAAAIKQATWCSVTPLGELPAPTAGHQALGFSEGSKTEPLKSLLAADSSPGRMARHTSSTEMTHTHGSISSRRRVAT